MKDEMTEQCATHREMRQAYEISVGKSEAKRKIWSPRNRWKDNIKSILNEIRCEVVDRIHLSQGMVQGRALENMALNLWVP
jgi:hypothetical protein